MGQVASVERSRKAPFGFAECITSKTNANSTPAVEIFSGENHSICYEIALSSLVDVEFNMAYSLRIYWAGSPTGLSSLATSNKFIEIRFQNLNDHSGTKKPKCVLTEDPCEQYLRDPSEKEEEDCKQSHAEVIVTKNDPNCSDNQQTGKQINICIQPGEEVDKLLINSTYKGTKAGRPRSNVLYTTVVAVFEKGQGGTKMLAEQEWSNSPWRTDSSCGDSAYLNNTSIDFTIGNAKNALRVLVAPETGMEDQGHVWLVPIDRRGSCPPNNKYCEDGPAEF